MQPAPIGSTETALATILVVEDDEEIQQLLRDLLEGSGYNVLVAGTGGAALELCANTAVDLVLLDVLLPDMMGYQVCQEIRGGALAEMPIIMLTALTRPDQVNEGLLKGADDYVKKPFNPSELKLRIDRQVQRYKALGARETEYAAITEVLELTRRQLAGARGIAQSEATLRQEFLQKVTTHFGALTGVIEAQIRRLPPGTARDAVQQIKMRVRGAALVYEVSAALQVDPAPIGDVIRTIVTALKSVYRPWKRVKVVVSPAEVMLPSTVAAPIAMVVNELVTNCFRHAFPENRFGAIDVK